MPITGTADCCARAASGHVAAAPPSSVIKSRRFTPVSPVLRRKGQHTSVVRETYCMRDFELNIEWSGPILPGMADYLRAALDTYARASHRVVLLLDLCRMPGRGGRPRHSRPQRNQTHAPAYHCCARRQAVRHHVHPHLPSRQPPSSCANEPLDRKRAVRPHLQRGMLICDRLT